MKHEPILKRLAFSQEQMQSALDAAPDRVNDPDLPYDPHDEAAVSAFWANAEVRQPAKRGKQKAAVKVPVYIRLNPDVLAYFKQDGQGWQTRLNDALQEYMKQHPNKAV